MIVVNGSVSLLTDEPGDDGILPHFTMESVKEMTIKKQ